MKPYIFRIDIIWEMFEVHVYMNTPIFVFMSVMLVTHGPKELDSQTLFNICFCS